VALSGTNASSFTLSATSMPSIATAGNATFTVGPNHGLTHGSYIATVTVSGGSDITARSFTVTFTVNDPGVPTLDAPIGLAIAGMVLMWDQVEGASGYQVYAGDNPIGNTTGAAATSFNLAAANPALTPGSTYQLSVRALGVTGVSNDSERSGQIPIEIQIPALTGTVTLSNMAPVVGNVLTATFTGNGTGAATWVWLRNGNVINGASGTTYTVVAADLGYTISARVSFADQTGSITSNPTAAVGLPTLTGTVTIDNTSPIVGDTLTALFTGNGTGTATWVWLRGDTVINGASGTTYTVVTADIGYTISARVSFANQTGSITSDPTAAVQPQVLTGNVTISNISPVVGDTLTALFTGNGTGTATWTWLRNGNVINGASGTTYPVVAADLGYTISARVSFANQIGSITSDPTAAVQLPALTGTVTISNMTPVVGDTLTATITDHNGTGAATWTWLRNGNEIAGASGNTYTVVAADLGQAISATVSFADQTGNRTGGPTAAVQLPALTGTVTIDNMSPMEGDTLTATFAGNGTGTATWVWMRNGTVIDGATTNVYTVTAADVDHAISVTVGFADQVGNRTAGPTAPVTAAPNVGDGNFTISLTPGITTSADIHIPAVSLGSTEAPPTITLLNPERFSNISWSMGANPIPETAISNNGATLTLGADVHNNRIATHRVTVEVVIGGVIHSRVIVFEVTL